MGNTSYFIDDIIKKNSEYGMSDADHWNFRLMINTAVKSENYCRICEEQNDPLKKKALQNSTLCYQHIRLCMATGKYI
jgi:hypothetical protein